MILRQMEEEERCAAPLCHQMQGLQSGDWSRKWTALLNLHKAADLWPLFRPPWSGLWWVFSGIIWGFCPSRIRKLPPFDLHTKLRVKVLPPQGWTQESLLLLSTLVIQQMLILPLGKSNVFLPFPPLVQTFAVLYLWIKFNRRHQVETGTQCFQHHLCLQQELHQIFLLLLLFHLQEEEASLFQLWHLETCRNYWSTAPF